MFSARNVFFDGCFLQTGFKYVLFPSLNGHLKCGSPLVPGEEKHIQK